MNFRNFWSDRKWDDLLKVALEMELSRITVPVKKGKTLEKYFEDLHNYATTFALRKISFLDEFEKKNNFVFSDRYKRKYLATCFDSYCEDLQKIVFSFLEAVYPFVFFDNFHGKSVADLKQICSVKFEEVFDRWFVKPLQAYMEKILEGNVWSFEKKEKFRRMHKDICNNIKKKGLGEIEKFFTNLSEKELRTNIEAFQEFRKKLKAEGFIC